MSAVVEELSKIKIFAGISRDAAGKYRGTLEVSLDAAHLRSLSGEKRLLEDKPA